MGVPRTGGQPSSIGQRELTSVNREAWRIRVRVGAAAVAVVFALAWLGFEVPAVPIVLVCLGFLVGPAIGLASIARGDAPRVPVWLQGLFDVAGITLGIGFAATGPAALLLRPAYVLAIVPASLASIESGLVAVAGACVGHGLLLAAAERFSVGALGSLGALGPPIVFVLVARQCALYADQVARKNAALATLAARVDEKQREVAEKGRLSTALLEVARALSATLEAPELLARMNRTARQQLRASWSATFLVNASRATFRLAAVAHAPSGPPSGVAGLELPLRGWLPVERLAAVPVLVLEGADADRFTQLVADGHRASSVLVAAVNNERVLGGFLAVGFAELAEPARARAIELLAGIAQHAGLVLRNARLLEEAREASALRSELVATVSHELRTPLNVILGYLQMLLDEDMGSLTDEQSDAVRRARGQSLALLETIPTLLELNRLEAGRLRLECQPVVIADLMGEVVQQLPETWARPGVQLQLSIVPNLPVVETDADKLRTILRSLLHNAFKFTDSGRVTLAARPGPGGEVAISVSDTGRGIPADALEHVFDLFHQVPGASGEGVGLGLHIVRRFVDLLGGTISVRSTLGRGSCFTITLPRGLEPAARAGGPGDAATARAA